MIYLDYAASTPVDTRVSEKMQLALTDSRWHSNPASTHAAGKWVREQIELARHEVASLMGAESSEIIWTSGATESINLALKGVASLYQAKGKHIITLATEHKAVLDTCHHLEKCGFRVTYLKPQQNGILPLEALANAITNETILVSVLYVNNETGVIQDIQGIANLTSSKGVLLHVDAVQAVGKLPIDVKAWPIDLLSVSSHKLYGPKGIGALYLRKKPRVRVEPLIHGGGHEQGMRSGTLATHQIIGMGEAYAIASKEREADFQHVSAMRDLLLSTLESIPCMRLNTDLQHASPYILSVRFEGLIAEAMLSAIPELIVSTTSACQASSHGGSHVIQAMGYSAEQAKSTIRFSFGRMTTEADILSASSLLQSLFAGGRKAISI